MQLDWRCAAAVALVPVLLWGQEAARPTLLKLEISDGAGATVARNAATPRRFSVRVTDGEGRAVPQVSVTFRLPEEGPTGWFASGLKSESMLSDERGEARVSGIRWNDEAGALRLLVVAVRGESRAEAAIPVEISATLQAPKVSPARGPSSSRKWLILAGVAVGAVAGMAVARGGSGSSSSSTYTVPPVVVAPTIGAPTIVIGRP